MISRDIISLFFALVVLILPPTTRAAKQYKKQNRDAISRIVNIDNETIHELSLRKSQLTHTKDK